MRRALPFFFALAACDGALVTTHGDGGAADAATHDAGAADSGARDLGAPGSDAGAPPDSGSAPDSGLGVDACVPRAACDPGECGTIPTGNGCGGPIACADVCTGGDVYCTASPAAMHQAAVTAAVNQVMADHPEYFDPVMFRDTSSWLVIDDAAYTAAVVAACNAMGVVCISDPNDDHEIRVHGPGDHLAENYGIRVHSTNRTWTRFMGGYCETTLF